MKIHIVTKVQGSYVDVMKSFDRELFESLQPIYPPITIQRFDGSTTGDEIHLRFGGIVPATWVSVITGEGHTQDRCWFIDEGKVLPFPLVNWRHEHIVSVAGSNDSLIIDQITYQASHWIWNILLFPFLYVSFWLRKPRYRRYFSRKYGIYGSN